MLFFLATNYTESNFLCIKNFLARLEKKILGCSDQQWIRAKMCWATIFDLFYTKLKQITITINHLNQRIQQSNRYTNFIVRCLMTEKQIL